MSLGTFFHVLPVLRILQVYAEFQLPEYPSLGPRITDYAQGSEPQRSVGQYFQRPGRTILERHLVDVPEPSSILNKGSLDDLSRVYFTGK